MKTPTAVLYFAVFALLLAVCPICLNLVGRGALLVPHFWALYSFVTGLTFIVVLSIIIGGKIVPAMSAQIFLAATTFKLLACLAFIMVFMLKTEVNKVVFVTNFFYLYFLNTAFEVYILLRNLRNQNLK